MVALCGLGAVAGYALGRNKAALGIMGKPARSVRRLAPSCAARLHVLPHTASCATGESTKRKEVRRVAAPMMADDIEGKLKGIIAEQLGVDEAKVPPFDDS